MISDKNTVEYCVKDLAIAGTIFFAFICIASVIYSMFDLTPGFFFPLTAALAASLVYKVIDFRNGKRSVIELKKNNKDFIILAISSTIFGLIMPMMFPSGAYDYTRWLVFINTIFLVGGLTGIPVYKGLAKLTQLVTRRRTQQTR